MKITDLRNKLHELYRKYGNIDIKIVNYYSDYKDDFVENIDKAVRYVDCPYSGKYILIGGENS